MMIYDKVNTTWLSLICLQQDSLSFPLRARLAAYKSGGFSETPVAMCMCRC